MKISKSKVRRYWPIPNCLKKYVPTKGVSAFAAPRDAGIGKVGKHTGVDIWAHLGDKVVAVEDGIVIKAGLFTGGTDEPRWLKTYAVMVQNDSGLVIVYGEVRKPKFKLGHKIKAGQIIGRIARVLKRGDENGGSPYMLHFELHKTGSKDFFDWYGKKPDILLDPTEYLSSLL